MNLIGGSSVLNEKEKMIKRSGSVLMEKKNTWKLLFAFLLSFLFITICSRNSFLYPINDGCDVNCYFTIGRSLLDGKVLYQDIYDQKVQFFILYMWN